MEYAEVLFYIAEITLVLSYSVTRMILLRFMACAADIGYIAAALLIGLDEAGMKPTFIFAVVAFLVNAVHIYRLLKMRLPATIPAQLQEVYRRKFAGLSPREFLHLTGIAESRYARNEIIIEENSMCDVFLALNGELAVTRRGNRLASLPALSIAGEVSALTRSESLASVATIGNVKLYRWTAECCDKLGKSHPELALKFQKILLGEMRQKMHLQNLAQFAAIA